MSVQQYDAKAYAILAIKVIVAVGIAYFIGGTAHDSGAGPVTAVALYLVTFLVLAYAMK